MKYLQKLGKSLMLPVACLPVASILMGIGYWIDPAGWGANNLIAAFMIKAGSALIDNMGILFAIGVGIGMSDDNDGTAGLAGLVSWLMMTTLFFMFLAPGLYFIHAVLSGISAVICTVLPVRVGFVDWVLSFKAPMAEIILEGLGGKENIISIDNCVTRLRLEIKDKYKINEKLVKSSGASGIIKPGKKSIQIIIGTKVQFVCDELKILYSM